MKVHPWKDYWKWWWQKFFSIPISYSMYGFIVITVLLVLKFISDTVFATCFGILFVQRCGKDIFDRLNNKNQKGNNDVKIQS